MIRTLLSYRKFKQNQRFVYLAAIQIFNTEDYQQSYRRRR